MRRHLHVHHSVRLLPALSATAFLAVAALFAGDAAAKAFTPGNIIISNNPFGSGQTLLEYTKAGALVQQVTIPQDGDDGARDLVLDANGNVQIYNGTFSVQLTQYTPNPGNTAGGTFTHRTIAGWSTANNLTYGGIATTGNYVYGTDMDTSGASEKGIVRFALNGEPALRFATANEYIDVTMGRDGYLYATQGVGAFGTPVDQYDPLTMQLVGSITLPNDIRAVAVDANGDYYVCSSQFSDIIHYNRQGQFVKSITDTTVGGLADMDIDASGNILIASHGGGILETTTALSALTTFSAPSSNFTNFAAWVAAPPTAVPEPTTLAATTTVALLTLRRPRRR